MKIGIFIAYHPNAELSNQGLGRLLRELTKGLLKVRGTEVALLCPSWLRRDVEELFSDIGSDRLSILAPPRVPAMVTVRNMFSGKGRKREEVLSPWARARRFLRAAAVRAFSAVEAAVITALSVRNIYLFAIVLGTLAAVGVILLPFYILALLAVALALVPLVIRRVPVVARMAGRARKLIDMAKARLPLRRRPPLKSAVFERIFRAETDLMIGMADASPDVDIWFSPTVFWPEFSSIRAPTVQAFPDMLISEFPTSFATDLLGAVAVYKRASRAIRAGRHFTSYSEATAAGGLARRFDVDKGRIHIIPHAPMDLSRFVAIRGTLDDAGARSKFATSLIHGYRNRNWAADPYLGTFDFTDTEFLFFASQFRPNKNLMNLIKAFEIVLRRRHRYCKLILTGSFLHDPEAERYVREKRLGRDVISAYDMPEQVLAAFYAKARLVVNPTLYEGGFPFTFAEGLSVGTPSVMSRIPQVTEVIKGSLAEAMLFDPFSVEDMADKIVYGLDNRDQLMALQMPLYDSMKSRTWADVAADHLAAFRTIIAEERR